MTRRRRIEKLQNIIRHFEHKEKLAVKSMYSCKQRFMEQQVVLDNLKSYKLQYVKELETHGFQGINITKLGNYQKFIENIDMVIGRHETLLQSARLQYDEAHLRWKKKYSKLNAVSNLADREKLAMNRLEQSGIQKQADELTLTRYQKSLKHPTE